MPGSILCLGIIRKDGHPLNGRLVRIKNSLESFKEKQWVETIEGSVERAYIEVDSISPIIPTKVKVYGKEMLTYLEYTEDGFFTLHITKGTLLKDGLCKFKLEADIEEEIPWNLGI